MYITALYNSRNMFAQNIIEATIFQHRTVLTKPDNTPDNFPATEYNISTANVQTTNILGIVVFSIVLGTAISLLKDRGQLLVQFFLAFSEAMMIITRWVIW